MLYSEFAYLAWKGEKYKKFILDFDTLKRHFASFAKCALMRSCALVPTALRYDIKLSKILLKNASQVHHPKSPNAMVDARTNSSD